VTEDRLTDDKRLIPEYGDVFWCHRLSERKWSYCKYCRRDVPCFQLTEGRMGQHSPEQVTRCCWECGSGLEILYERSHEQKVP